MINKNLVLSAHDVSDGGLIIALIEMSLGSHLGAIIEKPKKLSNLIEYFFGEDQGRYVLEIEEENYKKVENLLKSSNIFFEKIEERKKTYFEIENEMKIDIYDLSKINNKWYNNLLMPLPAEEIKKLIQSQFQMRLSKLKT